MPYELRDLKHVCLGTIQRPSFEVYDIYGSTDFALVSVTYEFILMSTADVALSGSGTVGSGQDEAGNTIKLIQMSLDLSETIITTGYYLLKMKIVLLNGETDNFRVIYSVINAEEVF